MAVRIDTVDARSKLKPQHEPYWTRITRGCYLGFRRMTAKSTGTWVARFRDPDEGKQKKESLGEFEELPPSQRYDATKRAAEVWFKHLGAGGKSEPITVKAACARYITRLRADHREGAAADAEARFSRWVNDSKIGRIDLQKLRPDDVWGWRSALAQTPAMEQDKSKPSTKLRASSTVNRDMTTLRAALNLALEDGFATTNASWVVKLRPIPDADGRRDVYIDIKQRKALIGESPPDLAVFLRALSMVPLRPGAMAALVVKNHDVRLSTLTIGKDKKGQDRKITLPKSTNAFFREQGKSKLPEAPLLTRADGKAWDKDAWKGPIKEAVTTAELPLATTAMALRHSTITDLIVLHRLDTLTVARLAGTSLQMIEKHYGHHLHGHAANALASLAL